MIERSTPRLSVLVADDEAAARDTLCSLVEARPEVAQVLEAKTGSAVFELVTRRRPHMMFLDIELPDVTGLQVLRGIEPELVPQTVFVTGHSAHAVPAFETEAVDYLLKPFTDRRFACAFERALRRVRQERQAELARRVGRVVRAEDATPRSAIPNARPVRDRIALKLGSCTELVPVQAIDWIEAADVYVRVHAGERSLLVREALDRLEEQLGPRGFLRVHRSALVNFRRVARIQRDEDGRHEVVLTDGSRVKVSRSGRGVLEDHLRQAS